MIIGIDPGFTGALAVFENGHPVTVYDMPVLKVGKKTELNEIALLNILQSHIGASVFVEKAQTMPGQGISSTGRYLVGYGIIRGMITALMMPLTLVHPKTWKAKLMRDMQKEKQASVLRCQQLYPEFACEWLKLKKHHGRADAILLAAYGCI